MRILKFSLTAAFVAVIGLGMSPAKADPDVCEGVTGNVVSNCGFETGDFTGWTFTAAASGSAAAVGGLPNSGLFAWNMGANDGQDDVIAQTLATSPGQVYAFTFYLQGDPGSTTNDFNAYWNGGAVLAVTNDVTSGYVEYTFDETGSGSDTISFGGGDVDGSYIQVDSVSVSPAVPEPATLFLLGAGMAGLAAVRRRRRH